MMINHLVTKNALSEIQRLTTADQLFKDKFRKLIDKIEVTFNADPIVSPELFDFFSGSGVTSLEFLTDKPAKSVSKILIQYLLIDMLTTSDMPMLGTIKRYSSLHKRANAFSVAF